MDLNFERIRNDKLDILRDISVKTFIETFASQNKEENIKQYLDTKMSLANLKEELNNMDSYFYFIILNNKIIGYTKLNFESAQTEKFLLVKLLRLKEYIFYLNIQEKVMEEKRLKTFFKLEKKRV